MAGIHVKSTAKRLVKNIQEFITGQKMANDRVGIDTIQYALYPISNGNTVEAGSTTEQIVFTGHGLSVGDVIRFEDDNLEYGVIEIVDANTFNISGILESDPTGRDYTALRYISLLANPDGSLSIGSSALRFNLDGSLVAVNEDTVTPSNNTPLPVKLTGATGDINITAGDLNVQTSHLGASFDSQRIGDGTNLLGVNVSNEALVHDADVLTQVTTVATETTSIDAKVSTEAKQDTMITSLANILTAVTNSYGTVVDQADGLLVDATTIPASSALPLEIVASLAADTIKVQTIEDIGEFIGIYTGAAASEVLQAVLPLGGGEVDLQLSIGDRVSIRNMKNAAITEAGDFAINFIG